MCSSDLLVNEINLFTSEKQEKRHVVVGGATEGYEHDFYQGTRARRYSNIGRDFLGFISYRPITSFLSSR